MAPLDGPLDQDARDVGPNVRLGPEVGREVLDGGPGAGVHLVCGPNDVNQEVHDPHRVVVVTPDAVRRWTSWMS